MYKYNDILDLLPIRFSWGQLAMSIEFSVMDSYAKTWIPEDWLTFSRFLNRRLVKP